MQFLALIYLLALCNLHVHVSRVYDNLCMHMEMSPRDCHMENDSQNMTQNYDLVNLQSNRSNNLYTLGGLNPKRLYSLNNLINEIAI